MSCYSYSAPVLRPVWTPCYVPAMQVDYLCRFLEPARGPTCDLRALSPTLCADCKWRYGRGSASRHDDSPSCSCSSRHLWRMAIVLARPDIVRRCKFSVCRGVRLLPLSLSSSHSLGRSASLLSSWRLSCKINHQS